MDAHRHTQNMDLEMLSLGLWDNVENFDKKFFIEFFNPYKPDIRQQLAYAWYSVLVNMHVVCISSIIYITFFTFFRSSSYLKLSTIYTTLLYNKLHTTCTTWMTDVVYFMHFYTINIPYCTMHCHITINHWIKSSSEYCFLKKWMFWQRPVFTGLFIRT